VFGAIEGILIERVLKRGLASKPWRFGGVRPDFLANEVGMLEKRLLSLFQIVLLRD
jgi:hypothetical protein